MSKLLTKSLFYYIGAAIVLLLLSAPVYYFLSQKLYLEDVDEAILLRRDEFIIENLPKLKASEISDWNRFNRDVHILPDTVKQATEAFFEQEVYDLLSDEWEPYRVLYSKVNIENEPHVLMIRMNLIETEDLLRTTAVLYLIILSTLLAGFVLVSKIIASKLWKPFYQTLSVMEQFKIEKQELPSFNHTDIFEFQELNKQLLDLTAQNIKAFQTQKEFTENASHELQTPLAIFRSKLDMLLQTPDLTEKQAEIIQELDESVSRISRVNKNLLLLAKMENEQFTDKEELNIIEMLDQVLPYFSEQAEEKKLQLSFEKNETIQVSANKGLTEILINNLLLNAIRHTAFQGHIIIQTQSNRLTISNSRTGEALQTEFLFQRFGKRSEQASSSGLGLAIVKKIAELNNWKVSYSFTETRHLFSVQF